jgi:cell division protein FtsI (penicillin-binding protein 3)
MVLWGAGIGVRLFFLQIVQSAYYIEKAEQQQRKLIPITPRRGDILDREGNVLARSVEVDSLFARPHEIKDLQRTAKTLSRLTGIPLREMTRKLSSSDHWVWVKRKLLKREKEAIELADLAGIGFQKEYRRVYPNREMASHLLGYVDVDEEGKAGLERSYNGPVRGEPGKILLLVDGLGKTYQREQQVPQAGATLTTTIDKTVQHIVEKELQAALAKTHASAISIVVLDPHSGAVLAMANAPAFNPNEYAKAPPSSWMNRSVGLTYEPGSTFKMVTIAAALEEGLTRPDEQIYCGDGFIVLHRRRIKDHKPYGMLSVREIIQNSSNVGTIKVALRLGEERFKEYIERYGFGEQTSVDLPGEVRGQLRDTSEWTKTSIASIAIGQEISVTPLQTASMVATIANGGIRYKPYVVQKVRDPLGGSVEIKPQGTRVMSEKTAQLLREMLEDVVTDGTAKGSQLEGYRAAGKTGTAQKVDPATGRYSKYIASFAGFAPLSNPRIAMVVVIDEPKGQYYGAEVAAPVFKRIAEQVLRMKSIAPDVPDYAPHYTASPEKNNEKATPKVVPAEPGAKVFEASLRLPEATDDSTLEFGGIVVPDFTGRSLRHAADEAGKLGLDAILDGSGSVVGQYPPPGAHVRPGTKIRLQLSLR